MAETGQSTARAWDASWAQMVAAEPAPDIPVMPLAEALDEGYGGGAPGFVPRGVRTEEEYLRTQEARLGMPLDIESGAPAWPRLVAKTLSSQQQVLEHWRNVYGRDAVTLDDEGNFVAQVPTASGELKAVRIDEPGFSWKDMVEWTPEALNIVGSMLALRYGKLPAWAGGGTKVLEPAITSAGGYTGARIGGQVAGRGVAGVEPEPGAEVARQAGLEVGLSIVGGYSLGKAFVGLGKFINMVRGAHLPASVATKLGTAPQPAQELSAAVSRVETGTGVKLPLTMPQILGDDTSARVAQFLSKIPFANSLMRTEAEGQVAASLAFQDVLLGGGVALKDEVLGTKLIRMIEPQVAARQQALVKAVEAAKTEPELKKLLAEETKRELSDLANRPLEAARAEAVGLAEEALSPGKLPLTVPLTAKGFGIRQALETKVRYQSFQAEAKTRWGKVKTHPEYSQDVFPTDPVVTTATDLKNSLPGLPAPGTAAGRERVAALEPSKLRSMLDDILEKFPGQKVRLQDLQQWRQNVNDLRASPQALADLGEANLAKLENAFTQAIDEGASGLPNTAFKADLDAARAHYRQIAKFQTKDVRELMAGPTEPGYVKREAVAAKLFRGGDVSAEQYASMKEFYGEKSPFMEDTRSFIVGKLREQMSDPVTRTVKLEKVLAWVDGLDAELKTDLLGGIEKAATLTTALRLGLKQNVEVPADAVEALLSSGRFTPQAAKLLVQAQEDLAQAYQNDAARIVGQALEGKKSLVPEEFAAYFLERGPVAAVREQMGRISAGDPALAQQVRVAFLMRLFEDTARKLPQTRAGLAAATAPGSRELDPLAITVRLGKREFAERAEAILEPDTLSLLKDYQIFARSQATATTTGGSAAGAGGMAGTMTLVGLISSPLRGARKVAEYLGLAYVLTNKQAQEYLRRAIDGLKSGNRRPVEFFNNWARTSILGSEEFSHLAVRQMEDFEELKSVAEALRQTQEPQP